MNRYIPFYGIVAFCLCIALGGGAAAAEEDRPEAELLSRIAAAVSRIERISSRFEQERHTSMLEASLYSSGTFHYRAPDCLRWEVSEPEVYGFETCGKRAVRWRGDSARAQAFSPDREPGIRMFADQVFAWVRGDFARLEKEYRISIVSRKPVTLALRPRHGETGGLARLTLTFSPELTHVEAVRVSETDGDYTRIRFRETVINGPEEKGVF